MVIIANKNGMPQNILEWLLSTGYKQADIDVWDADFAGQMQGWALMNMSRAPEKKADTGEVGRSRRRSVGQILEDANQSRRAPIVEGLIPSGAITLMSGEPKVGKTTIVASILDAMDSPIGTTWAGQAVTPGIAWVYIDEGLQSIAELLEDAGPAVDSKHQFSLVSQWVDLDWSMVTQSIAADFNATPEDERPSMIIIDTLGRWSEIDDMNSYGKAIQGFKYLQLLRDVTGCAIFVIHHSRKDRKDISDISTVSGTAAFGGQADCILTIRKTHKEGEEPDNNIRLIQNYGRFRNAIESLAVKYEGGTFTSDGIPFGIATKSQQRDVSDKNLLVYAQTLGTITVAQARGQLGCGRGAAQNALSRLVKSGAIVHNGRVDRWSAYEVVNNG